MLLPDVDVLLSAHRVDSADHQVLGPWLLARLDGPEPLGVSELVLSAVVRIATNHRTVPATTDEAVDFCEVVRHAPATTIVAPGPRHWAIFAELCRRTKARANIVPDAYLAALALEQGGTLVTSDRGLARFSGLRMLDPLAEWTGTAEWAG